MRIKKKKTEFQEYFYKKLKPNKLSLRAKQSNPCPTHLSATGRDGSDICFVRIEYSVFTYVRIATSLRSSQRHFIYV